MLSTSKKVCYDGKKKGEYAMYTIVKHYRNDPALRASFNALAEATFGLNFEGWYQNGFWGENYDPYSIFEDGKIVANVSLNRTDMVIGGQRKRIYQLGTVMTDPAYRNRGYIRTLMAEIEKDTADAEGVYLFGGDNVVEFYPKFGFRKGAEFLYSRPVSQAGENRMKQIPMDNPEGWAKLRAAMAESVAFSACEMVGNPELIFFYVSQFMTDCVYYEEAQDVWAVAELEDGVLTLHNVFAPKPVSLSEVIAAFGEEVKQVNLGFAPLETEGFSCQPWHEDDCTFFVKGDVFADFADRKLRIPSLSHA